MSSAYIAATTREFSKASRIEGHTSNVEQPILYQQFGKLVTGNAAATDTFIIPHKLVNVKFIATSPENAAGATLLYGANACTDGATINYAPASIFIQTTTVQAAGSTTLILAGTPAGYAVNDSINGCTIDIRFDNGDVQTTEITDFVASGTVATLKDPLVRAVAATGTYYRIRGSIMTLTSAATAPAFRVQVIGTFE